MTNDEQLVRQLYADFNARRMDAVLRMLTEDVMWANGMHGGHVHGREAVRGYWTGQWATIDPHVEPTRVTQAADGSTGVEVHQTVRDLQGQLLLDEVVQHVFRVENGQVRRFDIGSPSQLSSVAHGTD